MRTLSARTTALALATAATAAVLTTVSGADAAVGDPSAAGRPLDWGPCPGTSSDPRQECATLKVPLDHRDPDGKRISLAVSRIASERPHERRGVLLLIPGGPGAPGLDRPTTYGKRLPQSVRDAYDLVSFDPRGLGASTRADCGLSTADLSLTAARPWPAADGSIARNVTTGRRIADRCARNGGALVRSLSTVNEARDIDSIRRALGERKLSAWGTSYGTYAGSVYAQMFPERTDRWVLDSNDNPDPERVGRGWLANYAVGVEDTFPDFAAWASAPDSPVRLAGTPAGVRRRVLDLADRLDAKPLAWPGANPPELNGNVFRQSVLTALFSRNNFEGLARLIVDADAGKVPGAIPPDPGQDIAAVSLATLCNDVEWPRSLPGYARDVAASRKSHPLTAGMPVNVSACAFWHDAPRDKPVRITDQGPSNVLLVQNKRDVATPYREALKLRRAYGDRARMVSVDAMGHGAAYTGGGGSACADRRVTDFLLTGERPAGDITCPAVPGQGPVSSMR
ncbi:alpha/beta hydrolase [Streptomyces sp. NEAU-Y11]|uniref:alpha/beta hydrolase n=1 Tax=Streptomyces cucumeris TaxID=2962890 RepID=UPI0020C92B07|nr:alpha/beta hydrolase [Streptomyces sp. NEAU-Y11]MCP9210192.1 alpha/beta hydrolase [Streptomyces sp. NEAU-Y11]